MITRCQNVPNDILIPRSAWSDSATYDSSAKKLATLFAENYAQFQAGGVIKSSFEGLVP